MLSLSLGPFTLSLEHLALLASLGVALLLAQRLAPGSTTQNHVWRLWLLALLGARAAFVVAYWPLFNGQWLQTIDLRDGGFLAWAGIVLALLVAAGLGWRQRPLRRSLWPAVLAGVVLWLAADTTLDAYNGRAALPATALQRVDGSPVTLATHARGQPLVVNLWATWCPPCRREMPVLAQAQQRYPHVQFVFINQGESVGMVANFVATAGLPLNAMLLDPHGAFARDVGAHALPTTLFYSASGQLLGTHLGELSAASLAHAIKVLEPPASMP